MEWSFGGEERGDTDCYVKMIVAKADKKVKGIHYLGPNAGEVIQVILMNFIIVFIIIFIYIFYY